MNANFYITHKLSASLIANDARAHPYTYNVYLDAAISIFNCRMMIYLTISSLDICIVGLNIIKFLRKEIR